MKVDPSARDAFRALAAVLHSFHYEFRETAGGTINCRSITGGTKSSLHAHGIALDINPSRNAFRKTALKGLIQWGKQTDMPAEMIDAVEAIQTDAGKRVFEWGGRWSNIKDAMHFQLRLRPAELGPIDTATVAGWSEYLRFEGGQPTREDDMNEWSWTDTPASVPDLSERIRVTQILAGVEPDGQRDPELAKAIIEKVTPHVSNVDGWEIPSVADLTSGARTVDRIIHAGLIRANAAVTPEPVNDGT